MRWGRISSWPGLLGSVGESLLDVGRAELSALAADLGESGKRLRGALLLLLVALFFLFWALGAGVFVGVEVLTLWLPRWGAAAIVCVVLLVTALLLAAVGRRRLNRIEDPAATVRRRVMEHREWWDSRMIDSGESRSSDPDPDPERP